MLNWLYELVSWPLLLWHGILVRVLPGASASLDWTLAVVLVVVSVRLLMLPLTLSARRSSRAMARIQPRLKQLQRDHAGDRAALQEAHMKLMREAKANPLTGCIAIVVQIPVYVALNHVMRHLNPATTIGRDLYGWTTTEFVGAANSRIAGTPYAASMRTSSHDLAAMGADTPYVHVVLLSMVVLYVGLSVLLNWMPIYRDGWSLNHEQHLVQQVMLFGLPVGAFVVGVAVPAGVLLYLITSLLFSVIQVYYLGRDPAGQLVLV